jgi:hypothetical protein
VTETIARFEDILDKLPQRLIEIPEAAAAYKPDPDRWSKKEILGHLIDSASNNHQRFVRTQFAATLEFPEYEQESWVKSQAYATEAWSDLVTLWHLLNRHLLHVVKAMPDAVLSHECIIGGQPGVPLSLLVAGYLGHLDHHLQQIVLP